MTTIFYLLSALLIYFSYKAFRSGLDYLNFFKRELAKPRTQYAPFATVFVPCKGLEDGLEENLAALLDQEYSAYEVVFVVGSDVEPAITAIESVSRDDGKMKLAVADKAVDSSQKVENLREAVLHADPRSEVFVFVDSDARSSKTWLRDLAAPLEDSNIGAATGYRWFISKCPTFSSELRNVWNASIASALGPDRKDNFCWGGSMAIRRDVFEKLDIREKWRGTLSDDFTVTRALNAADLPIHFVPQALTASFEDCSFREMLEFTTRQMKITRVYAPKLWLVSFFGSGLFCLVMLWSVAIAIFSRQNDLSVAAALFTLAVVSVLSIGKSYLRLKAVRLVLQTYEPLLRRQRVPQMTLWAIAPFVFFINCVAALISRRIKWRGIGYEMISAAETRVLAIKDER